MDRHSHVAICGGRNTWVCCVVNLLLVCEWIQEGMFLWNASKILCNNMINVGSWFSPPLDVEELLMLEEISVHIHWMGEAGVKSTKIFEFLCSNYYPYSESFEERLQVHINSKVASVLPNCGHRGCCTPIAPTSRALYPCCRKVIWRGSPSPFSLFVHWKIYLKHDDDRFLTCSSAWMLLAINMSSWHQSCKLVHKIFLRSPT